MRRGVGIAAFETATSSQRGFDKLSTDLSHKQVEHLHIQLTQFRSALEHFATTHREKIKRDPAFRHQFQQMCASIGVDPLAGPRKGGWWAEMLGLGDWQYELGVQIVDICVSTRDRNGGLIELSELVRLLEKLRNVAGGEITDDDVVSSIKTLQPLGAGYEVIQVGDRKMVRSVTKELDNDQAVVLSIAREGGGRVLVRDLTEKLRWQNERAMAALDNMVMRDGLCWVDDQDPLASRSYWVPSVMQWDE